jgi:hypothetical protein
MNNFSITQATNLTALAGAIVVIARLFNHEFDQSQIEALLGAIAVIIATVISFINRYKKGDVTLAGTRKKSK